MERRPSWLSLLSLGVVASLAITACTGTTATTAPAPTATAVTPTATPVTPTGAPPVATPTAPGTPAATPTPPASEEPTPPPTAPTTSESPPPAAAGWTEYPNYGGDVDCENRTFNGNPYTGNLKKITAPDNSTVVFEFCNPDVSFLSQIAFSALAIDDADYLVAHMADGSILTAANGTGPYMLTEWDRGNRMDFAAYDGYWDATNAAKTPNLELLWADTAATRLVALNAGTVDGIDNPSKDDLEAIQNDADLAYFPRSGLNTFYLGFNNTIAPWNNLKVRQAIAQGIDRQALVDQYYPPGSEVATYFTPCAIPNGCDGDAYWEFNAEAAKALFDEGLAEEGLATSPAEGSGLTAFTTSLQFRNAVRGYLPAPPTIAVAIQQQLVDNLGLRAILDEQLSGTFLDNNAAGTLDGIFMLGWGADFPDTSNFMDYHFGPGTGLKFGDEIPELVAAIQTGDQSSDTAARTAAYGEANNIIREQVPAVIIAHGGSGAAYQADVVGAHAAPLLEQFSVMQAADRNILVFMQNAEPLSLYCGDESDGETLRACNQIKEALYAYVPGGLDAVPALATSCDPNAELTVWTCALRQGVKFHDGADFGADDVILSFAAQWDLLSDLHIGRTATFEYWAALIGQGYLNTAP